MDETDFFDGVVGGGDGTPNLVRTDLVDTSHVLEGVENPSRLDIKIVQFLALHPQLSHERARVHVAQMTDGEKRALIASYQQELGVVPLRD